MVGSGSACGFLRVCSGVVRFAFGQVSFRCIQGWFRVYSRVGPGFTLGLVKGWFRVSWGCIYWFPRVY